MKLSTLDDLLHHELKDLFSAENQLVKALPKMAKAATNDKLREGFEQHLEETKIHVARLEQIGKQLGKMLTGHKCKAMEGLVEEGAELIDEEAEDSVRDAGLIGAAQRVEHHDAGRDRRQSAGRHPASARFAARRCGVTSSINVIAETAPRSAVVTAAFCNCF